jgi:hypothetical protein
MAESKFGAIFDKATPPPEPTVRPLDRVEKPAPEPQTPAPRTGPGRPGGKGKTSNPEWEQTTVQLKRATKQAAKGVLLTRDDGQDLSDVLQQLLEQWVKRNQ